MARHGGERALHSLPITLPLAHHQVNGCSGSNRTSPISPLDSRIPRPSPSPSPTPLRRSSSLRGLHSLRGGGGGGAGSSSSGQQHRTHHQDFFPVITENGTPTKCSSSLSLTPSRGRTRPRASTGYTSGASASSQHGGIYSEDCSDIESVKSFGSNYSTASACDHASFALNGTTWSGRSRRYVVHCSSHTADNDEYLTPTQRAARQVRKFQALLREARKEIEEKDREIFRLTKEVVELRLYKASLNSPDEKTDSSETATVRENKPYSPDSPSKDLPDEGSFANSSAATSPRTPEKKESSLVDSGHFEDGSVNSKDSVVCLPTAATATTTATANDSCISATSTTYDDSIANILSVSSVREVSFHDDERKKIVDHYENRIEDMHRRHVDEVQLLKQYHNDKVESLLNQMADVSRRYCELRPTLDLAEDRAKELECQAESLRAELAEQKALFAEQEERNKQTYLKIYSKGQEAARIEQADQVVEQAQKNPTKTSVAELLQQLTVTQAELENIKSYQEYSPEPLALANRSQSLLSVQEAVSLWVLGKRKVMYRRILESRNNQGALDPEITLQFLKSAVYYFLTDKENLHGHLNAIESILGFTDTEKLNIDRIYRSARK